ncbi:MAG: CopD family protein [Chromatiales bacterium]|nr:CopD family protein [Chromatiales bacterium]
MFLWFKTLHLIFMVAWFAGLFYLPRLFVYHAMASDSDTIKHFTVMERKLFWGIMTPSAVLTMFFGGGMLIYGWAAYQTQWWMHVKLFIIFLLLAYHIWCGMLLRDFKHNRNKHGHVWYRWFNEITFVALVAVIWLAVFKPS